MVPVAHQDMAAIMNNLRTVIVAKINLVQPLLSKYSSHLQRLLLLLLQKLTVLKTIRNVKMKFLQNYTMILPLIIVPS